MNSPAVIRLPRRQVRAAAAEFRGRAPLPSPRSPATTTGVPQEKAKESASMKRQYYKRSFFPDGRGRHLWMHGYHRHIGSAKWERFRRELIEQRGNRCEQCGQEGGSLVLHHLHYKTLGNEQPEDVQLLCRDCHERADEKRAAVNRQLGQS
jgi:hypothetical protein